MSGLVLGKQVFRTISLSQLEVVYTENSNNLFSEQYPWNIREFTISYNTPPVLPLGKRHIFTFRQIKECTMFDL